MKTIVLGLVAMAVLAGLGTLETATAAVYSCTPLTGQGAPLAAAVHIYNGSLSTANITAKALSANGTNLNGALSITTNFTLASGNTKIIRWTPPACTGICWDPTQGTNASTVAVTMRIVSDQLIGAGVTWEFNGEKPFPCNLVSQ